MEANNIKEMREALEAARSFVVNLEIEPFSHLDEVASELLARIDAALAAKPHTGKWMNGRKYEYEYAYCSECGRMQWADWDTHKQAEENIESFACNYKYCPGCGAKMEGGVYVK